jgi:hypothetical protein
MATRVRGLISATFTSRAYERSGRLEHALLPRPAFRQRRMLREISSQ